MCYGADLLLESPAIYNHLALHQLASLLRSQIARPLFDVEWCNYELPKSPSDTAGAYHAILNLTAEEKRAYGFLFNQADSDQLGVVTGERAVAFFERTHVSPNVLGEIWQIADTENRGLLTKPGFCMVLRLIGHYQAGRTPTQEMAFKPAPIPRFEGLQIPGTQAGTAVTTPTVGGFPSAVLQPQLSGQGPIRVPPLDPQKVQQYSDLFERSGVQSGLLDGATAKSIFERAGLPNEVLGKIWNLSDREQRGALDQTEFIVAMHLLTSMKARTMTALPNTLPSGLYEAAARRGVPPPPSSRQPGAAGIPRQFTGSSAGVPARTQSPLTRSVPPVSAQTTSTSWLVTPPEKAKYDQFFATIDTQSLGVLTGEQAVQFFSDSRLPEETLATIWDLADINSAGQLTKDEFAVAMYLIRQQRMPNPPPLPAFLPPALIPPSMRQQQQQQAISTAPAFDNANNSSHLPKSAADDLFGLDEPAMSQAAPLPPQLTGLQSQTTGASVRDPFSGSSPSSPTSPKRFQPQPQPVSSVFKPFMPTSAFGASLAQQNTGGSTMSGHGQGRGLPQTSHLQQSSAADDLLGDNETNTEESSKLSSETTELANMSNQIGNLKSQMEQTQLKKTTAQRDLSTVSTQKRDLELRLQQFRSQYEQEVRTVKDLEQQLTTSRDSTKKLSQELAMLEGTYQDLQAQHTTIAQALQADQQENSALKQKISQVNAEVSTLKPQIEKMKLDARQQKGLVSINKKQLVTNEGELEKLQAQKDDLEREAVERAEQARNVPEEPSQNSNSFIAPIASALGGTAIGAAAVGAFETARGGFGNAEPASNVASPSGASTMSSTNPFFRKPSSNDTSERAVTSQDGPNPSAFDAIFGPSAAFAPSGQVHSRTSTPPATSFIGRAVAPPAHGIADSIQNSSSTGENTPAATPPANGNANDSPIAGQTAPPPAQYQFTPGSLPLGGLRHAEPSEASSTAVVPPASRAGGIETPRELDQNNVASPMLAPPGTFNAAQARVEENVPGAFPIESSTAEQAPPVPSISTKHDEFDSAFADFGEGEKAKDAEADSDDPFVVSRGQAQPSNGAFTGEFPPIRSLETEDSDDDSDEDSDKGFGDDFAARSPPRTDLAAGSFTAGNTAQVAGDSLPQITAQASPPSYETSKSAVYGGSGERSESNQFPPEFGGLLPSREDPTSSPSPSNEAARPSVSAAVVDDGAEPLTPTLTAQHTSGVALLPTAPTSAISEVFHDASSRPMSSMTSNAVNTPSLTQIPSTTQAKNAFDDFDDFDNLAEAKESDKSTSDLNFGFGAQHQDEFNANFDSPAASMTNTFPSAQQTPISKSLFNPSSEANGFSGFHPSASTSSAFGEAADSSNGNQTAGSGQHDWDAIFSGLDSSKNVDTSFPASDDPWNNSATVASTATDKLAPTTTSASNLTATGPTADNSFSGPAITPGTEHDDPILKRLTGMGYPRTEALNALEKYDYDINKVCSSPSLNQIFFR
nr:putative calcium-binding protein [Quercus suber]